MVALLKFGNGSIIYFTLYNGCNYLSMLGLKLNHFSKRHPRNVSSYTFCLTSCFNGLMLMDVYAGGKYSLCINQPYYLAEVNPRCPGKGGGHGAHPDDGYEADKNHLKYTHNYGESLKNVHKHCDLSSYITYSGLFISHWWTTWANKTTSCASEFEQCVFYIL